MNDYELREKIERTVRVTTTYLRKSSGALWWTERRPIDVAYWSLLDAALETAADIIEELPDEFFDDEPIGDPLGIAGTLGLDPSERFNMSDDRLAKAERVASLLRTRRERTVALRKISALENTTGRTPAEAESYRAKATELRERLEA